MAYNETGHAINVANFKELIAFAESLGADYTPPVEELKTNMLRKQALLLDDALQAVNDAQANNKKAIYERQINYENINSLASRVGAMLNVLSVEPKTIKDARSIISKIVGSNTKKAAVVANSEALPTKTVSTSQMSFEQRKNNFEKLIALVQAEPKYKPNDRDLEIETLQNYVKSLGESITRVLETEKVLDIARQKRDDLLYIEQIGAVVVGLRLKEYIKSKYSAKSSEYKRVQSIALVKRRTAA